MFCKDIEMKRNDFYFTLVGGFMNLWVARIASVKFKLKRATRQRNPALEMPGNSPPTLSLSLATFSVIRTSDSLQVQDTAHSYSSGGDNNPDHMPGVVESTTKRSSVSATLDQLTTPVCLQKDFTAQ